MPNTHSTAATLLRDTPLPLPLARIDRPREESAAARRAQHDARSVVAPEAGRLIIVSNRLPYRFEDDGEGGFELERSVGGLATGLGPLHEQDGNLWIGWADADAGMDDDERARLAAAFDERDCRAVFLDDRDAEAYYEGFSNSAIWPLFHGFPQFTRFDEEEWEAYRRVNERFCEAALAEARPGDTLWIQDYHLMLLPSMLREALPDASIGFFLHIPFPDYETFRTLPWRDEIVRGVLGADLIGFHAYDYVRHFLSSCRRVAGIENTSGTLTVDGRVVQVDAFPLGIDYARFRDAARTPEVQAAVETLAAEKGHEGCKVMLSVERLDYSKGIPERLDAFDAFLDKHPEWKGRVVLMLVTVPSRENVASYRALKKRIDELVGQVNGKHSTMDWTPVDYYYRSLPFEQLVSLYAASDVMLVTPLRDGMNLVCKEYLACHDGDGGVLVLSEMAGASYELHEALCVNPFDRAGIARAMQEALTMPPDEQRKRNAPMQQRLARYTSKKWAREFLDAVADVKRRQAGMSAHLLGPTSAGRLLEAYRRADRRALLLDYDGTLMPFSRASRPTNGCWTCWRAWAAARTTTWWWCRGATTPRSRHGWAGCPSTSWPSTAFGSPRKRTEARRAGGHGRCRNRSTTAGRTPSAPCWPTSSTARPDRCWKRRTTRWCGITACAAKSWPNGASSRSDAHWETAWPTAASRSWTAIR